MTAMRVDAKVVMLGKESVGKTSLVERYVHRRFLVGPYQNDTAGSERYEAMSRIYYRGARAAIVCYDLTDSSSFKRARFWVKELQNCEEHCKIYLCGTKSDLIEADRSVRQVDYHDVQDFADEIGAQHFETSSKTGKNVDEVFQKVADDFSSCALEFMQEKLLYHMIYSGMTGGSLSFTLLKASTGVFCFFFFLFFAVQYVEIGLLTEANINSAWQSILPKRKRHQASFRERCHRMEMIVANFHKLCLE
ncbi:hypothetical protein PO909_008461 [Leuciscus waleckii]